MTDLTSSMDLDENRITKPLARPRGSASAIRAEGDQGIKPPGPNDPEWPHLPSTPEKPPTTRQRLTNLEAGPNALQLEMQGELSALNDNEPPKPPPRARRSIGLSDSESDTGTDKPPTAVPEGELQVRSRMLQRTRSGPSGADFTHSTLLKHQPNTRQLRSSPLSPCRGMLLLVTLALIVRQPPDRTLWPPHASSPWESNQTELLRHLAHVDHPPLGQSTLQRRTGRYMSLAETPGTHGIAPPTRMALLRNLAHVDHPALGRGSHQNPVGRYVTLEENKI